VAWVREVLARAGGATRAAAIGCDGARLLSAAEHAHEMRARFTVLDLARLAGLWPRVALELIEALLA